MSELKEIYTDLNAPTVTDEKLLFEDSTSITKTYVTINKLAPSYYEAFVIGSGMLIVSKHRRDVLSSLIQTPKCSFDESCGHSTFMKTAINEDKSILRIWEQ